MSGRGTNLGKVLCFLRQWDQADEDARSRTLETFVAQKAGRISRDLEQEFAHADSLFLARITTCMRLTYKFSTFLALQLKAVQIFLCASSQDQYLTEFFEDGGVLTLIDILNQCQTKGEDRVEVLNVLWIVSNTGHKYKEFICESHAGVSALADCLSTPYSEEIQEKAWAVLDSLSRGNPRFADHLYQQLITLLLNTSPKSQTLLLGTLQSLQCKVKTAPHGVVDPLLQMLKTLWLEVQEEAIKLMIKLMHSDVRRLLLQGLVSLLRPAADEPDDSQTPQKMKSRTGSFTEFVQQAAAAKVVRLLAEDSDDIRRDLLALGVVQHLLSAMCNTEHSESQLQASLALEFFVRSSLITQKSVQRIMGDSLFSAFLSNPEAAYKTLSETQAESLLSNNILMQME